MSTQLNKHAPSLAGRAVLAIVLMVGFYVLAIALLLCIPLALFLRKPSTPAAPAAGH